MASSDVAIPASPTVASSAPPGSTPPNTGTRGLTSKEAQGKLQQIGPNSMPDTAAHPLGRAIEKLWVPVPWMLEAAIVLQLLMHKFTEAGVITTLLLFNAVIGFVQEGKAQTTLAALKSRLALNASVQRDGIWKTIPSAELVPDDIVKLSLWCSGSRRRDHSGRICSP